MPLGSSSATARIRLTIALLTLLSLVVSCAEREPEPERKKPEVVSQDPLVRRWSITVAANDDGFAPIEAVPLPAGPLSLIFQVSGTKPQEMQLMRLEDGVGVNDFVSEASRADAISDLAELAVPVGGSAVVQPGASQNVWVEVEAGLHALVSFVGSSGTNLVQPVKVGKAKGEHAETVKLPATDTIVGMTEYAFDEIELTSPGELIRLDNSGSEPHEALLLPGEVTGDVGVDEAVGGVAVLEPGGVAFFRTPAEPGDYTLVCMVRDESGRTHAEQGMVAPLRVE